MKSGQHEAVSESGVGWLRFAVSERLGWIFREQSNQDKGVDAHVEEVIDGHATGRLIGMQIKSGLSWLREKSAKSYIYRGDFEHLAYWQAHSLPILIVLFDPLNKEAYWQLVSDDHIRRTKRGWALSVPFSNQIQADAIPSWTYICSPESRKAYVRKVRKLSDIASSFENYPDRRQDLLYEALHQTSRSLIVSTPYIDAGSFSILDYISRKCPVRLLVGADHPKDVSRMITERSGTTLDVKVAPSLHLKQVIFDSLMLMSTSANLTSYSLSNPNESYRLIVDDTLCQHALENFFCAWEDCDSVTSACPSAWLSTPLTFSLGKAT